MPDIFSPDTISPILPNLYALFDALALPGVDRHGYVDYLFAKYSKLESLKGLNEEIEREQTGILTRAAGNDAAKRNLMEQIKQVGRR